LQQKEKNEALDPKLSQQWI